MSDKKPGILKRPNKGVQPATIDKVAAQVAAAETATAHAYESKHVPLSRIKFWESQPRTFLTTFDDVCRGYILKDDEHYEHKTKELEALVGLAMSLREFGMINSPLAYALPGQDVQLLGGQRRTMASILALFHIKTTINQDDVAEHDYLINEKPNLDLLQTERIVVKVFNKKPDELTLEQIGMLDNVQHVELPVADKITWLLRFADMKERRGRRVSWRDMVDTLGLSRSQSYLMVKLAENRDDQWVKKGIAKVINEQIALTKLLELASLAELERGAFYNTHFENRPAPDKVNNRVSLGATDNLPALKHLILSNIDDQEVSRFDDIDWSKPKMVKKAFAQFLDYWAAKHG